MGQSKEVPEWRQYEWLISKIYHDKYSSIETTVLKNTRLIGEYSERSREIDILVKAANELTLVECKHYSRPVDLKEVESFLSMYSDVKAQYGVMVSSSGFTKSATKRIREFGHRITLEHLDWESAFINSFEEISYGRISDICSSCFSGRRIGREVPGLLCWEHGLAVKYVGKLYLFSLGTCLKCGTKTVYCDSCGLLNSSSESCCELSKAISQNF